MALLMDSQPVMLLQKRHWQSIADGSAYSDDALGHYGFPGHVPPAANLIFDIELKGINETKLAT
jgi:hypothetical protein